MKLSGRGRRLLMFATLAVFACVLVLARRIQGIDPATAPAGARIALQVMTPGIHLLAAADRRISEAVEALLDLTNAHRRAERLEEESAELRREVGELRISLRRMGRWPALVAAAEVMNVPTAAVEVLAVADPETVLVDAGTAHGVQAGFAAVAPDGLAGRVVSAAARSSHVRLLIAREMTVTALLGSSEQPGLVRGLGARDRLEFIPEDQGMELNIGDRVITAGLEGSLFPTGLLIGEVSEIGSTERGLRSATVRPAVNFQRIEDLLIVIGTPPRVRPLEGRRLLASAEIETPIRAVVRSYGRAVVLIPNLTSIPVPLAVPASPESTAAAASDSSPESISSLSTPEISLSSAPSHHRTIAPSHDRTATR